MQPTKTSGEQLTGLAKWSREHPYASLSIQIHVALSLILLANLDWFIPKVTYGRPLPSAEHYTHKSRMQAMEQRVDDMEAVKQALDKLITQMDTPEPDPIKTDPPLGEPKGKQKPDRSLDEVYAQSEDLLESIKAGHDEILRQKLQATSLDDLPDPSPQADIDEPMQKLTDSELMRATAENQMEARKLFEAVLRSRASETSGHSVQEGTGKGSFDEGLMPSTELSVEQHFSRISQGYVRDVTGEMQRQYGSLAGEPVEHLPMGENNSPPGGLGNGALTFTRKISEKGRATKWIALDSWYFIGPFPNPGRININTRFPPEIAVDLDAVYLGGENQPLRWEYIQYDFLPIIPPDFTDYAVYYAYTELYSEKSRDVWLAIGSDDQSKLWVNDLLVWQSGNREKPWSMREGYRKITLKPGSNRFLFRLENGVHRAAFSVTLAGAKRDD